MKLKCIIFDVDGTMADTERDGHRVAFNLAFAENKLNWHWDEELYGQLLAVTGGKERIHYYQTNFLKQSILDDAAIKDLHVCKTKHYIQLLKSGKIPLRKGVKRLIKEAKDENITLAIATTTTPINVTTLLQSTLGKDAESLFKVIAAGDIVPNKKPAADIYQYALQKLNIKANQCIAIEDSSAGLESAVQAGIKTIVTTNLYTQNQDFSKATKVLANFSEVNVQLLNQLIGENYV
jgi:HAD superfamily hydrolase (TIGR01509 family)